MRRVGGIVVVALLALSALAADHPTVARGFSPEKVYHFQGVDSVNLFNANLNLTLPLGSRYPLDGGADYGITLTYNSKLWRYETLSHPDTQLPYNVAIPIAGNAGFGWTLALGTISFDSYIDPSGSEHPFYATLHGESPFYSCVPGIGGTCLITSGVREVRYTADGTSLRMTMYSNGTYLLESATGEKRTFDSSGRLTTVSDQYGLLYTVAYATNQFSITDKHGRTQTVHYKTTSNAEPIFKLLVDKVVLTATPDANGTARTATYLFTYADVNIPRDCRHENVGGDTGRMIVPFLTKIEQDELDWSYQFGYDTVNACTSGVVTSMTLPTLGRYEWVYERQGIPIPACGQQGLTTDTPGVIEKKEFAYGKTTADATWKYALSEVGEELMPRCDGEPGLLSVWRELKRSVTSPDNHRTDHFFNVWTYGMVSPTDGSSHDDYGLPFIRREPDPTTGAFRSREEYDCGGSCVLKRTNFVLYEGTKDFHPRVHTSRTIFHESSGDQTVDQTNADYDGYGHYRQTTVTTNIGGPKRTTYTRYNNGSGANGRAAGQNALLINYPAAWVTERFDRRTVYDERTENNVTVSENAVTDYCFSAKAFLRGQRLYKNAGSGTTAATIEPVSSTNDVIVMFEEDSVTGNVSGQRWYGGDRNPLTFSSLCALPTQAAEYRTAYGYSRGVRVSEQREGIAWKSADLEVDGATGLVTRSTDPAGMTQTFTYDVTGQLLSVVSDDSDANVTDPATITYAYTNASPRTGNPGDGFRDVAAAPARVTITRGDTDSEVLFDWFGRVWREKQKMPSDSWSVRETLYDGQWRRASVSEYATLVIPTRSPTAPADQPDPTELDFIPPNKTTTLYDAFGRVTRVTAPDASVATFGYVGAAETRRTAKVATEWGAPTPPPADGEVEVTRQELRDGLGRVVSVTEGFDAQNADNPNALTASYSYDVGDRLVKVSLENPAGAAQERLFTYDLRGFLVTEQHPELGINGDGTATYADYDSRGHAWRKTTGTEFGTFDLKMTLDAAERVTEVARRTSSSTSQKVKEFVYDVGTRANGKVSLAARYNVDPDLGTTSGDHIGTLAVTESFQYDGVGGAPSRHDIAIENVPGRLAGTSFFMSQTYTSLGLPSTLTYPCRKTGDGCEAGDPSRALAYVYSRGLLSSIADQGATHASSFSYAPNGMVTAVVHGSSPVVTENWTVDPKGLARPRRITLTTAAGTLWDSGDYAYDDSGNIASIGTTSYRYDPYNRLVVWQTNGENGAFSRVARQYDAFGNFRYDALQGCGPLPPAGQRRNCYSSGVATLPLDSTKNRYQNLTYDDAGNQTSGEQAQYTYDSMNMMRRALAGGRDYRFLYAANDERVGVVERVSGANRATWTMRGFDGKLLRSWTDDATSGTRTVTWKEDEIFRGTQVLASITSAGAKHYALDHLGSPRYVQSPSPLPSGKQDFEPFGGGGVLEAGVLKFTGHERDASSIGAGNVALPDYMHARYYLPGVGRFLSVDPIIDVEAAMRNPQMWNRYSYVANNPINRIDPTGKLGCKVDGKQIDCHIVVVYDKDKSKGTIYLVGTFGKGKSQTEKILLQGKVVVGADGKTPTGTFTAGRWEKDHVSTRYGWQANTPWSKSPMGINAFGPYQLHIKEFESRGIWIHGTMGPGRVGSSEFNRLVSPTSHGCVRCSNPTIMRLHDMMPEPQGNKITISTNPQDAPDDDD